MALLTDGGDPILVPGDPGRIVEMREQGTEGLLMAFKRSGKQYTGEAANIDTKLMALRLCIIRDGDEALTYQTLQGGFWDERFSMKETLVLMNVWARVHEPSAEDLEGLGGALRVKSGG